MTLTFSAERYNISINKTFGKDDTALIPYSVGTLHRLSETYFIWKHPCNRQIHFVVFYFHQIIIYLMVYHHLIGNEMNFHVYVYHSFCHYSFHKSWFVQFRQYCHYDKLRKTIVTSNDSVVEVKFDLWLFWLSKIHINCFT